MLSAHKLLDAIYDGELYIECVHGGFRKDPVIAYVDYEAFKKLERKEDLKSTFASDLEKTELEQQRERVMSNYAGGMQVLRWAFGENVDDAARIQAGNIDQYPDEFQTDSNVYKLPFRKMYYEIRIGDYVIMTILMHSKDVHGGILHIDDMRDQFQDYTIRDTDLWGTNVIYYIKDDIYTYPMITYVMAKEGWIFARLGNQLPQKLREWALDQKYGLREAIIICNQLVLKAMNTTGKVFERETPPKRLNKARKKRGDTPLFEHKTMIVNPNKKRYKRSGVEATGSHRSPRLHLRRGHWRHYRDEDGNVKHRTWIDPMWVGAEEEGRISKDYEIKPDYEPRTADHQTDS